MNCCCLCVTNIRSLWAEEDIVQRCNAHGCKNEWGKTGISVLCSDLHLLLSAGNAECPALHGSKRIMQRCNAYGHKIRNCLQRCKCRTNEKSRVNLDLGITWVYCWMREMVAVHDFYETKNECNVAAVHKNYVTRGRSCTAARCFYTWDGLWTNLRQKAGHLSRHSFLELECFMGQGKNCWLVQIGIFPIIFQFVPNFKIWIKNRCCV